MFGKFTEEAQKVLMLSRKEMIDLNHSFIGTEHFLLALLSQKNCSITSKLNDFGLNYDNFKKELINIVGKGDKPTNWYVYTPLMKRVIEASILDSRDNNNGTVTLTHLFDALLEEGEGVAVRIIYSLGLDYDELYNVFVDEDGFCEKSLKKLLIDELGVDLVAKAKQGELDPVIGRDDEIRRLIEILSRRTKNNPILVGNAGVGKTAIVEELARLISIGNVPSNLKNMRIVSLDMATMVAGTKYRGEFEERVRKILKELEESNNIIIFIDEIHTLVGAGGAEGAIDASNIFKPALARNKFKCIGATTSDEYKQYIENDAALDRRFQKIDILEPSNSTVLDILFKLKPIYEDYHGVIIPDDVLSKIPELSNKYVYDRYEPDKSLDILDEVCSRVRLKHSDFYKKISVLDNKLQEIKTSKNLAILKHDFDNAVKFREQEFEMISEINSFNLKFLKKSTKSVITISDVASVINSKTNIPIYDILNDNLKSVKLLKQKLQGTVYGQDDVILELIKTAKRIKFGYKREQKPYSFLFSGQSGVGKTLLAKTFGTHFVGLDNVIKLDMSEYKEEHSVSKILGSPPGYVGYDDNNYLLDIIRDKPYSVLIVDEIERAHPAVLNLFFQILDDGKIKDSKGRIVRFDNVIIIMTTNVGNSEKFVGFNSDDNSLKNNALKEYFSVEFLNRIDEIFMFNKIDQKTITKIVKSKLNEVINYYHDKIKVQYSSSVVDEIISLCDYQTYGARKIDKIIKTKLDDIIIDSIVNKSEQVYIEKLFV